MHETLPEQARRAIARHMLWADDFMVVGEYVSVAEELADAAAVASEFSDELTESRISHLFE